MSKYKKLLVAIDGSERSMHAYYEALKFSKLNNLEIVAISVVFPPRGLSSALSIIARFTDVIKKPYIKALEEAKDIAEEENVKIKTIYKEGEPYKEIIKTAQEENCDLIVAGRRGETGLARIFIGSVTSLLINESPVDLLIIPKDTKINTDKFLLIIQDLQDKDKIFKKAGELAKIYNSELNILYIIIEILTETITGYEDIMLSLRNAVEKEFMSIKGELDKLNISYRFFVKYGFSYKIIEETSKELRPGMIISENINNREGKFIEKIIAQSSVPTLVFKFF